MSIKISQAKCTVDIGLPVIYCFQHLDQQLVELKKSSKCHKTSGAPNDGFLLNALKTLFRLCRVLSNL